MRRGLTLLLLLCAALVGRADSYVIELKPEESQAFRFVPMSVRDYAITHRGRRIAYLVRARHRLFNPAVRGLSGRIRGERAVVRCRSFLKGPVEFRFEKGVLVSLKRWKSPLEQRDIDEKLVRAAISPRSDLTCLWPSEQEKKSTYRDWWAAQKGLKRLRLWYFNPNGAGTLFAELALVGFGLFLLSRGKALKGAGVVLTAAFFVLTLLTGSRGSVLAFGCGAIPMLLLATRTRLSRRAVAFAAIGLVAVAVLMSCGTFGARFGSKFLSLGWSNAERLRIWREVPRMLVAAPMGWGLDQSGLAYCDWFQPMGAYHPVKWLVSSHLTWIVEFGRWFFVGYAFAWLTLVGLAFRRALKGDRTSVAAFGLLLLWFVACWFSTVGVFASLWILPGLAALCVLIGTVRDFKRTDGVLLFVCAVLALAAPFAVETAGRHMRPRKSCHLAVTRCAGRTVIGKGEPKTCLVPDAEVLSGDFVGAFGRAVRAYARRHKGLEAFAVVDSIDRLPAEVDRLVVCGRACRECLKRCPQSKSLVFLSPPFGPGEIPPALAESGRLTVVYGEFARRLDSRLAELPAWCLTVPRAELYLPNWMRWIGGTK